MTAYLINESASTPSISDPGWSVTPPTSFIFGGTGTRTAYAWATDPYGDISLAATQTVTITPSFNANNFSSPLPAEFFGQSWGSISNWPSVPFGGVRLWMQTPSEDWAHTETSNGQYNWAPLDEWLAAANANGEDVEYTFGVIPQWASPQSSGTCTLNSIGCTAPPTDVLSGDSTWKTYVTALVEHSLASHTAHIKYYELWNEPDLTAFYTGTMPQLVTMACDADTIIHTLDPSAQVISPVPSGGGGTNSAGWLAEYFAAGGTNCQDIISYHAYVGGTDPSFMWTATNNVRAVMSNYGIGSEPLWNTEGGSGQASLSSAQAEGYVGAFYTIAWAQGFGRNYWYSWDGGTYAPEWNSTSGVLPAGIAYAQVYGWLEGSYQPSTTPCYQSVDNTWHCNLTLANGDPAQIVWNETTQKSLTVSSSFTTYETLDNSNQNTISSNTVTVSNKPILLVDPDISSQPTTAVASAPTITDFVLPSTGTSTFVVVPVTTFTAEDAYLPVAAYLITESSSTPSVSNSNWATSTPATFTFAGTGTRSAYAWVKDTSGNISAAASQTVSITQAAPTNVYYSVGLRAIS